MILEKRRMTIDEVANLFEISHGSAYDIIHNNRVAICQRLLDRYANKGEALFDMNSHWGRNMGPLFCTGKQTPEHGMKTSGITSEKEIQESTFCGKSVAHNFLGLTRGNSGTLSGKGHNSKQCTAGMSN